MKPGWEENERLLRPVVVHLALTLLLGTVLVAAGLRKLRSGAGFEAALRELVPDWASRALRSAVPVGEIAVGGWLLSGYAAPAAAATAVALLLVFSAALIRLAASGRYAGCGCFGHAFGEAESPHVALARNAALGLAGAALLVVPASGPLWPGDPATVAGASTVAFGLFLVWHCVVALAQPPAWEAA